MRAWEGWMRERQVGPSTQMARVESFLVRQRHLRVVQQKKKNVIQKEKRKTDDGYNARWRRGRGRARIGAYSLGRPRLGSRPATSRDTPLVG